MLWADSANDYLKIRNEANTNWNIIGKLGSEGLVLTSAGDPNGSVTGLYEGQILFDATNNIPWFYSGSSTSWFTSNGTASLSLPNNITTKTANYTALTTDNIILCDATSGAFTITLYPASGNAGRKLTIIKTDTSTNAITIDANGSETINGALTQSLNSQHSTLTLVCDGSNWRIESGKLSKVLLLLCRILIKKSFLFNKLNLDKTSIFFDKLICFIFAKNSSFSEKYFLFESKTIFPS
jgi:hypothetical protein